MDNSDYQYTGESVFPFVPDDEMTTGYTSLIEEKNRFVSSHKKIRAAMAAAFKTMYGFDIGTGEENPPSGLSIFSCGSDEPLLKGPLRAAIHDMDRYLEEHRKLYRRPMVLNLQPLLGGDALLQEILNDLSELDEESREEQYALCSDDAKSNAERILKKIYADFPHRYEIYPTEDREVSILAGEGHGKGRAVLILCDSEGGASCFVAFDGETRSAHYQSADKLLSSSFLKEALFELKCLGHDSEVVT